MQHECRVTVLETKVFKNYQRKYLANPIPVSVLSLSRGILFF